MCLEDDENSIWAIKKIKLDGDDELRACVLNEIDLLVALRGVCLRGRERVCLVCVYVCRGSSWCVCVSESVWGV